MAVLFHVNGESFSQWKNKQRLPSGKNLYKLGESLRSYREEWAEEYYRILVITNPSIPAELRELVRWWGDESATDEQRKVIAEKIKHELDVLDKLDNGGKGKNK